MRVSLHASKVLTLQTQTISSHLPVSSSLDILSGLSLPHVASFKTVIGYTDRSANLKD